MLHTIKTSVSVSPPVSLPRILSASKLGHKTSTVRFCSAQPDMQSADDNNNNKMDSSHENRQNTKEVTEHGDVMSHSFGEGYATRSDEEGFGGIYGGNQSLQKDKPIHENHPGYDKTQGSEVKEKEKARHQTSANA